MFNVKPSKSNLRKSKKEKSEHSKLLICMERDLIFVYMLAMGFDLEATQRVLKAIIRTSTLSDHTSFLIIKLHTAS